MIEIIKQIEVAAHPVYAWKVVSDLEGFADWCSYVRITFSETSESAISYFFKRDRKSRLEAEFKGKMTLVVPGKYIVLHYEGALTRFEESFEVKPGDKPGTSVITHALRLKGIGATLLGFMIRKRLEEALGYIDLELKHRVLAVAKAANKRALKGGPPAKPKTRK